MTDPDEIAAIREHVRDMTARLGVARTKKILRQLMGLEDAPGDDALARIDPKYVPLTVCLELLSNRVFAAMGDSDGGVVWIYDPKNRIMTPQVRNYDDLPQMAAEFAIWFGGEGEPDGPVAVLERAIVLTKAHFLRRRIQERVRIQDFEDAAKARALLRELLNDPEADAPRDGARGSGPDG